MNLLASTVLWGFAAALPAVLAEYMYKTWPSGVPWWHGLWAWIPLQLTIGYCIFRLVSTPNTTLMDAFCVWAFSTIAMRVLVSMFVLDEVVKGGTWFALGLILMARVAQTFWGR